MARRPTASLFISLCCLTSAVQAQVVVEEVGTGGAAARAGLEPGDVLVAWERAANPPANREPAAGQFLSPFDPRDVEVEHAPRGPLEIVVTRGGDRLRLAMPPGRWGLTTRPELVRDALASLREAEARAESGDPTAAAAILGDLGSSLLDDGDALVAAWLMLEAASHADAGGADDTAGRLRQSAFEAARQHPDPRYRAWVLQLEGDALRDASRLPEACVTHERALLVRERELGDSLATAMSLNRLGAVVWKQGDVGEARELWRRCLELRQRLAPGSLDVAASLNNLGILAFDSGDLAAADDLYSRSLAIIEQIDPHGIQVGLSLTNLGLLAQARGDLALAEARYRRGSAVIEAIASGSAPHGHILINAANVTFERGDLGGAERTYLRALEILEETSPGSLETAAVLNNLGVVAHSRCNLSGADRYYRQSLEIRQRLAPGSLDVAGSLNNLGEIARLRKDYEVAESYFGDSLQIHTRIAPESLEVANVLANQSALATELGELDRARDLLLRALGIRERLAPNGLFVAAALHELARVSQLGGDLEDAERFLRRGLELSAVLAPHSSQHANTLHDLGAVLVARDQRDEGLDLMRAAIEALESRRGRAGGALENRGVFRHHRHLYQVPMQLLLESGHRAEAWSVFERSRSQGLLAMLAERDLVFTADVPEELDRERRLLAAEADAIIAELHGVPAVTDEAEVDSASRGVGGLAPAESSQRRDDLLAELQQLHLRQEEVRQKIRVASPRLADLVYPSPLDIGATQLMLEPGTLLLAYSVAESCHLFIVEAGGRSLRAQRLETSENDLRREVSSFRTLLQQPTSDLDELSAIGQRLARVLLAPAAAEISRARRLVIVPDGPLHLLPFAALPDAAAARTGRYLAEVAPVSVVASATVLSQIKQTRKERGAATVVAFADPSADPVIRESDSSGVRGLPQELRFRRLPASRREVATLAGLFGERAKVYLGAEATEERAKSLGAGVTHVHFAVHGYADEQLPLDSALILNVPAGAADGRDNGILQAWEVLEQIRLDADLVVLSACDTALGQEVSGEGLIGLTRAFQYAGARTVLASLWPVADESTAALMTRFYRFLKDGSATNEALQKAQLALLRNPVEVPLPDGGSRAFDARHPFYWAAFELAGDWR